MLYQFTEALVRLQTERGILCAADRKIYGYAYRLLFGRMISAGIMLGIGIATDTMAELLLFTVLFVALRQYAGGFHFAHSGVCILFSAILADGCAVFAKSMGTGFANHLLLVFEAFGYCVIWFFSPVDTGNKRLDRMEKDVYRKRSRFILNVQMILYAAAAAVNWKEVVILIGSVHVVIAVGMLVEMLKKHSFFHQWLVETNKKSVNRPENNREKSI